MPTVAYLTNLFPSPVEPYVVDEIAELRRRGISVAPCSVRAASSLSNDLRPLAAETIYLQFVFRSLMSTVWLCLVKFALLKDFFGRVLLQGTESPTRRLRALIHTLLGVYYAVLLRNKCVKHIHVHHGYFGSWVAMIAARLLDIPFSLTLHGSDLLLHGAYLDTKLEHCKFCLTVSEFNRRHILKHYPDAVPEKIVVLRMGVDCVTRPGSSPASLRSTLVMLAVGRLHPVKDHAFLVKACRLLKDRGGRFVCQIAGEGEERESLKRLILDLHLENEVRLLGQLSREQLAERYHAADLVVLTSRSEGIPLVLMEAMAHGKPVLAPEITGIPELVRDGITGFLYRSGSLEDFVARVEYIGAFHPALQTLCSAARQHVLEHFNRERNMVAWGDFFVSRLAIPNLQVSRLNPAPRSANYENPVLQ